MRAYSHYFWLGGAVVMTSLTSRRLQPIPSPAVKQDNGMKLDQAKCNSQASTDNTELSLIPTLSAAMENTRC